ncbi:protein arginine N-methyltransferase 9-like [Bacillus rossius redtenbacheri]|uniref:protein arginine N-methyltransferase 9-like n=1 Tax=Bacillus rossius redtenbacheri TaxID=93214 RepID=UPI002FDEA1AB
MDPKAQLKVARNSRKQAYFYLKKGKFGRAFSHLLVTLKLAPNLKPELKELFSSTLCTWGKSLENSGRYNDLFNCYEQALEVFPGHEVLLSNLGGHLYRLGHLREACCYFRQARVANPSYLPAISNLYNCCNLAVERWHYRMLNDGCRNETYRSAIVKALRGGDKVVLDIGCGTGILSLFAVEGDASKVYACDGSDTMIQIATQVVESNNASSKVKLINKLSHDLQIPSDIPSRVSLVVTEIFDAGLLGERVLQTILHAWDSLLAPDGEVLPRGAVLWACAVECPRLAARQYLSESARGLLGRAAHVACEQDEPYGCEDLASLPGGFRYLTSPVVACAVNFNDPEEVRCLLQGDSDRDVDAQCMETGVAHAVVAWFTLSLGDEELTTRPLTERRAECWDQAVFPLPAARGLSSGQRVTLRVRCRGGRLSVGIVGASDAGPRSCGKDGSVERGAETDGLRKELESLQLKASSEPTPVVVVPQEVVSFLNDEQMTGCLRQVAETLCAAETRDGLSVLDLSPFPLLGTLLAGRLPRAEVWCTAQCEALVHAVAGERLHCVAQTQLDSLLSSGTLQFDVILVHVLDPSGKLKEAAVSQLPLVRKCLKKDGLFIPRRLTVHGKLVCSDWLDKMSRVLSDNLTCGKKVSQFINMYAVPEHRDFHLSAVHHVAYSDPAELLHVELAEPPGRRAGATAHVPLTRTGHVTALPYWYSLTLLEGLRVSTLRDDSHVRQAAVVLHPHLKVRQGQGVQVRTSLDDGFLSIHVSRPQLEHDDDDDDDDDDAA